MSQVATMDLCHDEDSTSTILKHLFTSDRKRQLQFQDRYREFVSAENEQAEEKQQQQPSQLQQQQATPPKRQRVSSRKSAAQQASVDAALERTNPALYYAITCRDVKEIIHTACVNLQNFENLPMMEWSEAVMLQLCSFHEPLEFSHIDWRAIKPILDNQWRREVSVPLREHVGSRETLGHLLVRNHIIKCGRGLIKSNEVFHSVPVGINYKLLKEYVVEPSTKVSRTNLFKIKTHI